MWSPCSHRGFFRAVEMETLAKAILLDRVDSESGITSIAGQDHRFVNILEDETEYLSIRDFVLTRAESALDASVGKYVPQAIRVTCDRLRTAHWHGSR